MTYQRFRLPEPEPPLATLATVATKAASPREIAASLATKPADEEYAESAGIVPSDSDDAPDLPGSKAPLATVATVATEVKPSGESVADVASVATEEPDAGYEERAGIIEHDGGIPREWAEGFASLDLMRPPPGFGQDRWRQLIDDAGRFIDHWAVTAAAMGWSAIDVFGLHPDAPAARYDGMGLVPLISGGEVVAIDAGHATIRTPGGSCLTYYLRRQTSTGVPVWELVGRTGP